MKLEFHIMVCKLELVCAYADEHERDDELQ